MSAVLRQRYRQQYLLPVHRRCSGQDPGGDLDAGCHFQGGKWQGYYEYKLKEKSANIFYNVVDNAKSYNAVKLAQNIKAPTLFVIAEKEVSKKRK